MRVGSAGRGRRAHGVRGAGNTTGERNSLSGCGGDACVLRLWALTRSPACPLPVPCLCPAASSIPFSAWGPPTSCQHPVVPWRAHRHHPRSPLISRPSLPLQSPWATRGMCAVRSLGTVIQPGAQGSVCSKRGAQVQVERAPGSLAAGTGLHKTASLGCVFRLGKSVRFALLQSPRECELCLRCVWLPARSPGRSTLFPAACLLSPGP